VSPRDVLKCSNKKYLFNCDVCFHQFSLKLVNITCSKQWCQYSEKQSKTKTSIQKFRN
jgi:hypothetical protein